MPLSEHDLRGVLHYDPETGVFTWRVRRGPVHPGDVAGTLQRRGYWKITIDRTCYQAHNLAWLYMTGRWPEHEIDHIDRDKLNNRFANLRDVPSATNQHNIVAPQRNNTSGFRGVRRHGCRWVAEIKVNYRKHHLGVFDTPEEASAAYWAAKADLHGVDAYGGGTDQDPEHMAEVAKMAGA